MNAKARIKPLDGVRGIAVMMVFLSHTSGRDQVLVEWLNFVGIGHVGVYLFFGLSAFLLGLGLFTKPLDGEAIRKFFIKRFLRIIPLYYTVVLGTFAFQHFSGTYNDRYLHVSEGFTGLWQHLIFYRGDGVFWSIVSEMQFYLLVPLVVWALVRFQRKGLLVLLAIALVNFGLYLAKYGLKLDWIAHISPNTLERGSFIDVFIPGVIAAWLATVHKNWLLEQKERLTKWATAAFVVLMVLTFILVCKNFLGFNRPLYEFRFFSMIYGIGFSAFILSVYIGNPLNKLLSNRFLGYIGVVGFSFYLLHMGVFRAMNTFTDWTGSVKFFVSFALVLGVSTVTYRLIEKPSVNLAYWLIGKLGKRKPA